MIFFVFLLLHYSLENDVSEHLEWLKFQKFSGVSALKLPQREVTQCPSAPPPQLYRALPMKIRCPFQFFLILPFFSKISLENPPLPRKFAFF